MLAFRPDMVGADIDPALSWRLRRYCEHFQFAGES